MLREMTLDDLFAVSTTLNVRMSIRAMRSAAQTFASDKGVSAEEAMAIVLVAFQIAKGASVQEVVETKDRRMRELERLISAPAPQTDRGEG